MGGGNRCITQRHRGLLTHRIGQSWDIVEALEAPVQSHQAAALQIEFLSMSVSVHTCSPLSAGSKMEVVPASQRVATLREPAENPYRSVGAWIFLAMIFMAGTLFGLWLPRLCQKGHWMGGQLKILGRKSWAKVRAVVDIIQCWANENSTMNRSLLRGGTPKRGTHMNTEQTSPPWYNSSEIEEHEGTADSSHQGNQGRPNTSGPSQPALSAPGGEREIRRPKQESQEKPKFRKAMEAMITAASPRK